MQWPTTVARRGAVPLLVRRKMNGCSLFGCSARSNRLCENGCPDFSLLLLLGADEQIFGVNEQILGQHRFHRMDIRAPWCLNMGVISSWRSDHEKAQYAWDCRWCRVIGCGALHASMVARECGLCGATANAVTS